MEQNNKPLFVIDDDPIVDWPVIVKLPMSGGEFVDHQFTVSMRVLSPQEYEDLCDKKPDIPALPADATDLKAPAKAAPLLSEIVELNAPIFQRLITGWQGVNDRAGNAVVYTPEKLAEQVTGKRGPALSAGLWNAINEIRYGRRLNDGTQNDGARLGN